MTSLIKSSGIYIGANILNAAVPFLLLPILTRYLTPNEYGEVAIFTVLIGAYSAIAGLSVHGAAVRKYYDNVSKDQLAQYIGSCLQILCVSSLGLLIVSFLFRDSISEWLNLRIEYIFSAIVVAAFTFISTIRLGQWQASKKPIKYASFDIFRSVTDFLLATTFVVVLLLGVEGRVLAQSVSAFLFGLIAIGLFHRDNLLHFFCWRPDYLKEALSFGVPLLPHVLGIFLLKSVDRFVINSELGLDAAGLYMVALQFSLALAIVLQSFNRAYTPWLFEKLKNNNDRDLRMIVRSTYLYFGASILAGIAAFILGPPLITFIAGQEYSGAGEVIGWLVLGQAFGGMYLMVTNYIFYSKRTGMLGLSTVMTGAINVGLLFYLTSLIGLEGAAIAFCFSMFLRFIFTWYIAQQRHPMPWISALKN